MKPWRPSAEETAVVAEAIGAARQVQTFLWGEANGEWGLEEWLRMFRKRVAKLEEVRRDQPHASVELRKRLLQAAALSIALIGIVDRDGVPWDASEGAPPSNLPQYGEPVGADRQRSIDEHVRAHGMGQESTRDMFVEWLIAEGADDLVSKIEANGGWPPGTRG